MTKIPQRFTEDPGRSPKIVEDHGRSPKIPEDFQILPKNPRISQRFEICYTLRDNKRTVFAVSQQPFWD